MPAPQVFDGSVYRKGKGGWVFDGTTWRKAKQMCVFDGSAWRCSSFNTSLGGAPSALGEVAPVNFNTVEFWVKDLNYPGGSFNEGGLVVDWSSDYYGWGIYRNGTGMNFSFRTAEDYWDTQYLAAKPSWVPGGWNHLSIGVSYSANEQAFIGVIINGDFQTPPVGGEYWASYLYSQTGQYTFRLQVSNWLLDEVRLWATARSIPDILANMYNEVDGQPLYYYKMYESTNNVIPNSGTQSGGLIMGSSAFALVNDTPF
jgi:hypothetical protein